MLFLIISWCVCSCVYDIISRQFINTIFSGGGFIDALLIIGLPNGPTALLRKDIKVSCFFCQKLYVYLFSNSRNNMFLLVYIVFSLFIYKINW